ncbi:MAG: phosphate ABC transporter ATP-binding protein [Deltaproteobacteria bacterium CG11_big_fil_rev_8_21_14_0_20_49_13]|nr:MAG: phosphate ABC transporter ATP-binding protein [Deltaproteobacteria bacterium CG11_big_fil_rev_8_21_14_0_20_49_13]
MQNKIAINKLNVFFGKEQALKDISFDVKNNEILTVIGPANSGKSTLLLAINRMIDRVSNAKVYGEIVIDGEQVSGIRDVENLRRKIGMVYAMPIPLPMSIRDNILFGARMKRMLKKKEENEMVESTLRASFLWDEVKDRLDSSGMKLSGGQQQRLCISRTLAVKPDVIMFDEPCSGLDPISTAKVEDAMKELKRDHAIILVTNNTKQAARVGDRTAFLLMGELVEIDDTNKIFTAPSRKKTEEYITGKFG